MKLFFWKMQGAGNDFIVLNALQQPIKLTKKIINYLADRHFGVGCDQVLVLEKARHSEEDFFYRIFNADGSEVGQCGNGSRCLALFIREQNIASHNPLRLGTLTTRLLVKFVENNLIEVSMGVPQFSPEKIPFIPSKAKEGSITTSLGRLKFFVLNVGNPHAVTIVPDVALIDVARVGSEVTAHPAFPEKTNVIFMELFNPGRIKCRIYERGAGETLACGSGACAAVVAGIQHSLLNENVLVQLPGGELEVNWKGEEVWLKGPATKVFEGVIDDVEDTDFI